MSDSARLNLLYHIIEIVTSSSDLKERQERVLDTLVRALDARAGIMFAAENDRQSFIPTYIFPRNLKERLPEIWRPSQDFLHFISMHRQPFSLEKDQFTDSQLNAMADEGLVVMLPIQDDRNYYGLQVLVLAAELSDEDKILLQGLVRVIASMSRSFSYYRESKQRITELSLLAEVGQISSSMLDIQVLLQTIVDLACRFLGSASGLICLKRQLDNEILRAQYGDLPEKQLSLLSEPVYTKQDDFKRCLYLYNNPDRENRSVCIMLPFKGNISGYLCLFDKITLPGATEQVFSADELKLLSIMGSMMAPTMENAMIFRQIEDLAISNAQMVAALGSLYEIGNYMLASTRLMHRVMVLLQSLVHPAGFDCERAVFFEVDHKGGRLNSLVMLDTQGQRQPKPLADTLSDLLLQSPDDLLEKFFVEPRLSYDLRDTDNFLVKALKHGNTLLVQDPATDSNIPEPLLALMQKSSFLILPLASKGEGVGMILVNKSIYAIDQSALNLFKMLSDQSELALEASLTMRNLHLAHKELAEMRTQLLEADRLASLGEIASGMAHEIRNPLMAIGGLTTRARKRMNTDDPNSVYLDAVIEEVKRMENVLKEIFAIPYDMDKNLTNAPISSIMDDALLLLGGMTAAIAVTREYEKNLPEVYCDERLIKQVFFNIMMNAVQAISGHSGKIILRTKSLTRDGRLMVVGEVEDSGGGISLDIMHNVFDPFFTTKGEGSGLGLSYAYKIVARHGGTIEVHNRGQGAAFTVLLPAAGKSL